MDHLSFLTDKHVPSVVISTLRSNDFIVEITKEQYRERTIDEDHLADSTSNGHVLITNSRDFVGYGETNDHTGIIIYATQELDPGAFVKGIKRIDRYISSESMRNNIEWLEQWLD